MGLSIYPTKKHIEWCLRQMAGQWRIRSLFLVRKKHMYYPIGWRAGDTPAAQSSGDS